MSCGLGINKSGHQAFSAIVHIIEKNKRQQQLNQQSREIRAKINSTHTADTGVDRIKILTNMKLYQDTIQLQNREQHEKYSPSANTKAVKNSKNCAGLTKYKGLRLPPPLRDTRPSKRAGNVLSTHSNNDNQRSKELHHMQNVFNLNSDTKSPTVNLTKTSRFKAAVHRVNDSKTKTVGDFFKSVKSWFQNVIKKKSKATSIGQKFKAPIKNINSHSQSQNSSSNDSIIWRQGVEKSPQATVLSSKMKRMVRKVDLGKQKTMSTFFKSVNQWFKNIGKRNKSDEKDKDTGDTKPEIARSVDQNQCSTTSDSKLAFSNNRRSIHEVEDRRSVMARYLHKRKPRNNNLASIEIASSKVKTSAANSFTNDKEINQNSEIDSEKQHSTPFGHAKLERKQAWVLDNEADNRSNAKESKTGNETPETLLPFGHPLILHDGWAQYWDSSTGKPFYYNSLNDQVSWFKPTQQNGTTAVRETLNGRVIDGNEAWSNARRSGLRGYGRHQLNMEQNEMKLLTEQSIQKQQKAFEPVGSNTTATVTPLSAILTNKTSSSKKTTTKRYGMKRSVKQALKRASGKMSFADAVKARGFGKAFAELPSTIKFVAALKKFGRTLARPFSKDKYYRERGRKRHRQKSRHGPTA